MNRLAPETEPAYGIPLKVARPSLFIPRIRPYAVLTSIDSDLPDSANNWPYGIPAVKAAAIEPRVTNWRLVSLSEVRSNIELTSFLSLAIATITIEGQFIHLIRSSNPLTIAFRAYPRRKMNPAPERQCTSPRIIVTGPSSPDGSSGESHL